MSVDSDHESGFETEIFGGDLFHVPNVGTNPAVRLPQTSKM
jgi:hypothetical protein